ncbi:tetratricopeptide repeat-containing diguanylate cyclase [Roseateles saccharophilus]|uniref:diguanylate cyclase n=1 Tax=Roseateles saccharophilus TaxID=304 RepID=A0A4R3UJY1_ROSSA|nr:tetratricopeptide repeat-containing diguanylate cyclase [Roseateles saccharophilus]MDG0833991.1 diguanylate cyclase [Roseateles saccharophilus]TCU90927.1 diguanylate cyclase (GGDEF)-like protein [Roseateles saccharophilus]
MNQPGRTLIATLALALALAAAVPATPVTAPDPASEDNWLADLTRRAFDDPDGMLAELQRRWPTQAEPGQPREAAWLLARGRVLLAAGQLEAADAVAVQLMGRPDGVDRSWLLRALAQERAGKPGGALAARALGGLDARCPTGDEMRAVRELGCDFRSAWEALRIIQRDQASQGELVASEASTRRGLALARAGGDKYLVVQSLGLLATVLQAQEHGDAARAELHAAEVEAQGDPLAGARVRNAQAVVERRANDIGAARSALEGALLLAEQAGALHFAAMMRSNLVDAYMHQGQLKEALAVGQKALPVLQRFHDRYFERLLHHNLAVAHIKLHQFDTARQELAKVGEFGIDPAALAQRARELRELGDTWAEAGQYKEALAAFAGERDLNARANERNRASALEELRRKYDSAAKQRDLDLLARDGQLKDQQLENQKLAQQVGIAVGALLLLSLGLIAVTLLRMRRAQARLTANQSLLRAQSERDPLTDLSNRRHFLAVMEQRSQEADAESRAEGFHGALMMIDIDHFKNVNDWHGHAAGDAVIVEVARRIRAAVRDTDLVVRWGGEEFLVFAPELPGSDLAQMAERILRGIGVEPIPTSEGPLRVTVSIGFASFPLGGSAGPGLRLHWEQAVNWADMVLYKAKAEGRNRAVGITAVDAPDADLLASLLQDFDAACLNGQVRLKLLLGPA